MVEIRAHSRCITALDVATEAGLVSGQPHTQARFLLLLCGEKERERA